MKHNMEPFDIVIVDMIFVQLIPIDERTGDFFDVSNAFLCD